MARAQGPIPLYQNDHAILNWMADQVDTDMAPRWSDSAHYIEDQNNNGFYDRRAISRWDGAVPHPTFVYSITASLTTPPPRFTGFGDVVNFPGDNPGPTTGTSGRATPDTSTSGSDRYDKSRHWESPVAREATLRHQALTSRERFHKEPYWRDGHFDDAPRDQRDRQFDRNRTRFHNYTLAADDRQRARDASIARSRGLEPSPSPPSLSFRDMRHGQDVPPCIVANVDLAALPRGPDGHPQSAWAVAQDRDDPPDDDVVCPPPDPDYVSTEEARILRVRTRPPRDRRDNITPIRRQRDARLLGMWFTAQIATLEQAYNLCALMTEGSAESFTLFSLIVQNHATFPLEFRTEGEAYLMRNQQELGRNYWITTTGTTRASRTERHPPPGGYRGRSSPGPSRASTSSAGMQEGPSQPRTYGPQPSFPLAPLTFGSTTSVRPPDDSKRAQPTKDKPRATTPVVSMDPGPSYLGQSPPNPLDEPPTYEMSGFPSPSARITTRWTIGEAMHVYVLRNPLHWGTGVRNFLFEIATMLGDSPNQDDTLGYLTSAALAPLNRRALAHWYHLFINMVVRLFSIRGLFAHVVRIGGYPQAALPMEHYGYATDNITLELVAAWFVQHGIWLGSDDVAILEDFARVRRNILAGITDLSNREWADEPRNACALERTNITAWADIHHIPIPPVVAPAAGLEASVHAVTMEGVTQTPPASDTTTTSVVGGKPDEKPTSE
ncbi:hypothetical protein B0H11DRAFT_1906249 [Mycena galericulata]|nr:hypothetical protein B0H11DRAFT_1906249 [Mycena galericulata]